MLQGKIEQLIEPSLQALGYVLWSCDFVPQKNSALLRIYIDRLDEKPVSLDDCTKASRDVSALLDVEDLIKTRYYLEVSSPGLNRQLHHPAQFERYCGYAIKLRLHSAWENQKHWTGILDKIENDQVFLTLENGVIMHVPFTNIQKATVVGK